MQINKKKLIKFGIINLGVYVVLFVLCFILTGIVQSNFDSPEKISGFKLWFADLGSLLTRYLMSISYILPNKMSYSVFGNLIAYVWGFFMTIPFTLVILGIVKFIKSGRKSWSPNKG